MHPALRVYIVVCVCLSVGGNARKEGAWRACNCPQKEDAAKCWQNAASVCFLLSSSARFAFAALAVLSTAQAGPQAATPPAAASVYLSICAFTLDAAVVVAVSLLNDGKRLSTHKTRKERRNATNNLLASALRLISVSVDN